jgi:hypothetical protein
MRLLNDVRLGDTATMPAAAGERIAPHGILPARVSIFRDALAAAQFACSLAIGHGYFTPPFSFVGLAWAAPLDEV